ncbi:MAG TPA: class F sortase [Cryptosporangiaceae bacterium]|nr:class F sortase [Cryptosporangiaceae bacterium]
MSGRHRTPGNHRGLAAAVVAGVLALSGTVSVGFALAEQRLPTQVPLAAADTDAVPTPGSLPASQRPRAAPTSAAPVGLVLPPSAPVALAVPAIGVKSRLLHLGQTADGALEVPGPGPAYDQAAWYRYSPTPGVLGPAIISGHVDSAANGPSVFFRLGSLRPRDTIHVTRADGSVAVFAVDQVRRFHKKGFPTQLVYGDTDHAALRLITCGGEFDRRSGDYLDNIVVMASLVRSSGGPASAKVPQPGRREPLRDTP